MKNISLVVVMLVLLSVGFVSAEQGDIEVGLHLTGYVYLYGIYNITDRLEAYLGYSKYISGVSA